MYGRVRAISPVSGEQALQDRLGAELRTVVPIDAHVTRRLISPLDSEQARLFEVESHKENGDPRSDPKVVVLGCFMGYGAGCTSNEPTSHDSGPTITTGRGRPRWSSLTWQSASGIWSIATLPASSA